MKSFKSILFVLLTVSQSYTVWGQETLQEKYDLLVSQSETYQQFKVIPRTDLSSFWTEVTDTLKRASSVNNDLTNKIADQKNTITSLETQLGTVQAELTESLEANDSISFLGIVFSKGGYHLLVWGIIVVLAIAAVVVYLMFVRSNSVTTKAKKEFQELSEEFATHKDKAREAQVKLKRELQTAVNQLNERRS